MTTRHLLCDAAYCLRAAALPVLALGVLTASRGVRREDLELPALDGLLVLAWQVTVVAVVVWLAFAVSLAATRPRRDRRAHQRLEYLRELAAEPDRVLVSVQTTIWTTGAGQHAAVLNVATGVLHRVWLPESTVPIGAFVALERTNGGVRVIDWMNAHQVEAGHRHEQRHGAHRPSSVEPRLQLLEQEDRDAALQLIAETEQFLKEQESI